MGKKYGETCDTPLASVSKIGEEELRKADKTDLFGIPDIRRSINVVKSPVKSVKPNHVNEFAPR